MNYVEESYDVVVIGAGHAGCEAALACARLKFSTILFTVSIESIAMMPCNPNIGGSSKGHLVREVDALGGEMGINIDKTFIQSRMLNASKGPAVHSLRAQADKAAYSQEMRKTLQSTDGLTIRQAEVTEILKEGSEITGVRTLSGAVYHAKAVILCTGVYLSSRCLYGEVIEQTGPNGLKSANHLSDSLKKCGIRLNRFKTGTPARIDRRSIDFSEITEMKGDEPVVPFSFTTDPASIQKEQVSCYLTYTNEETAQIIRENLDRSPLYSGVIEGTGPRYCPSIEDKVVRFPEKERHQIFVEPEGLNTNEIYLSGMSSSMPEDVQYRMIRTMPGFHHAVIVRNAYAIEYDCLAPGQLREDLSVRGLSGLFSAGQMNGSSGYEEAAAQGIMAGINAARFLQGKDPIVLKRSDAYIGVLIDDLVTKEITEPYRMMTSRAEYRLLLRQDNADLRLAGIGYEAGLLSEERYLAVKQKEKEIEAELERVRHITVGAGKTVTEFLEQNGSIPLTHGMPLTELIRRPELSYEKTSPLDPERPALSDGVKEQVNIHIKYEGYIKRQIQQVAEFQRLEKRQIPDGIDYHEITGLRLEAREKLQRIRPASIGQAGRIAGVSPADVSVLLVYMEQYERKQRS